MSISYKVLGQAYPAANTVSTIYTVPSGANTIVSTLSICNQSNSSTAVSIAVQPGGMSLVPQNYIMYNTPLAGYDTITLTMGMTLGSADVLSVNTYSSTVSITAFGSEIR